MSYDVVVAGGGAGGLNTALVLARSRRRVAVVDAGEPRNGPSAHVQGFLGHDGADPAALLRAGRDELTRYGVERLADRATGAERTGDGGFVLHRAGGDPLSTRRLVVATGLQDTLPELPGVRERWGRDLLHCPYCHGWEVRDRPIAVLGTHPGAVHHALLLRQWSADLLYLPHTRETSPQEAAQLAARGIELVDGEVAGLVVDGDTLTGVALADGRTVAREAVFVFPHMTPNDDLLLALGCERESGWVPVDPTGRTSVPGLWAVGNVVDPRAQVVTAAGNGSAAAFAINTDLVMAEVAAATPSDGAAAGPA